MTSSQQDLSPFSGVSAFPLTPLRGEDIDEESYLGLIERLVLDGVDSITALGSTGSYAYLDADERARVIELTVDSALDIPVLAGIGALRTRDVLTHARRAEAAGAQGLLLAPMSYQPLTDDEVVELFATVAAATELPIVVYDNPGTTHFTFTTELYARLAEIDEIVSIKIPGAPLPPDAWDDRIAEIREAVGHSVTIGISGDAFGAAGLIAGCDAWYTAVGGTVPEPMLEITRAVGLGDVEQARELSADLQPLWDLFTEFGGSLRVTAAIAEHLGLVGPDCLPRPLRDLDKAAKQRVAEVADRLELD